MCIYIYVCMYVYICIILKLLSLLLLCNIWVCKNNYVIARSQGTCLVVGGCVCSSLLKLGELRPSNGLNETFSPTWCLLVPCRCSQHLANYRLAYKFEAAFRDMTGTGAPCNISTSCSSIKCLCNDRLNCSLSTYDYVTVSNTCQSLWGAQPEVNAGVLWDAVGCRGHLLLYAFMIFLCLHSKQLVQPVQAARNISYKIICRSSSPTKGSMYMVTGTGGHARRQSNFLGSTTVKDFRAT